MLKKILLLIGGAAIGAGSTYFVMNKKIDKIIDEKDAEIDSIMRLYEEKISDKKNEPSEEKEALNREIEPSRGILEGPKQEEFVKYAEISKKYGENYVKNPKNNDEIDESHIKSITVDEWVETDATQLTLYVYNNDQSGYNGLIVIDEDENVVEDPGRLVGKGLIESMDFGESAWVLNEELGAAYEIVRLDEDYIPLGGH